MWYKDIPEKPRKGAITCTDPPVRPVLSHTSARSSATRVSAGKNEVCKNLKEQCVDRIWERDGNSPGMLLRGGETGRGACPPSGEFKPNLTNLVGLP